MTNNISLEDAQLLEEELQVKAVERGHDGIKIREFGELFSIQRHLFSSTWMVAVDEDGDVLEAQPKKLDKDMVRAGLKKLVQHKKDKALKEAEQAQLAREKRRAAKKAKARELAEEAARRLQEGEAELGAFVAKEDELEEVNDPAAGSGEQVDNGGQQGGQGLGDLM